MTKKKKKKKSVTLENNYETYSEIIMVFNGTELYYLTLPAATANSSEKLTKTPHYLTLPSFHFRFKNSRSQLHR